MSNIFTRFINQIFGRKSIVSMGTDNPIVVVLGATGTGKSKLAVEIAKKYNGEVISADSMQIYQGLDIVTNKVTVAEQDGIPHHMINFVHPHSTSYKVTDFKNKVLPIIHKLHNENKLPVIVGGTHYYIEAILWNILIQTDGVSNKRELNSDINFEFNGNRECSLSKKHKLETEGNVQKSDITPSCVTISDDPKSMREDASIDVDSLTDDEVMKRLQEVDPVSAEIYHPNEKRKIKRSLEVYYTTGIPQSIHFEKQRELAGGKCLGGTLRFSNVALLWIQCEKTVLSNRLDSRVDDMIAAGLVKELIKFHEEYNSSRFCDQSEDVGNRYKIGIFQSIGFKEFHNYLIMDAEQRSSDAGKVAFEQGVEDMKLHTRQYSTRQIKWIRNRFLVRDRTILPVYAVNGTDPSLWESNVNVPALEIVKCLLKGDKCVIEQVPREEQNELIKSGDKTRHVCEICDKVIIGNLQWNGHINGAKHRKCLKARKKKEDNFAPQIQQVS